MSKNIDLGSLVNYIKGQVTGQLNAPAYTSATAFTGTIAGYLGFDTSGNILTTSGVTQWVTTGTDIYYNTGSVIIGNTSKIYGGTFEIGGTTGVSQWIYTSSTTSVAQLVFKASGDGLFLQGIFGASATGTTFGLANGSLAYLTASTYSNAGYPSALAIGTFNSTPIVFGTNGSERMRIQAGGNISIGNTNNTYKLDVTGDINISGSFRINGTALSTGVTGSGSTNYVPLWTSTTGLGNSIIYNASGNLGINSTTNGYTLNAIRSASTQFTQSYKGAGNLMQVMSRFMQDESSNKGIAIGYLNTGNVSGIWSTNTGALMLGVWTTTLYKTKLYLTEDNVAVDIPTSGGGLTSGMLWNDGGTVKIIT